MKIGCVLRGSDAALAWSGSQMSTPARAPRSANERE